MSHLSFFWIPERRHQLISALESEFAHLVTASINAGRLTLPPISDSVLKIQSLSVQESVTISDIAQCLAEDPSLTATVIRVANSVIFNRRSIICTDLVAAVSRLGILRVRDIVTAQAIEQLKHSVNLSRECNRILVSSAHASRELATTMVLVAQTFKEIAPETYTHIETDKALLVGLLADIGLFCLVNEYHLYLENGNYLDLDLALQMFNSNCAYASKLVLSHWGFDHDFLEVASNTELKASQTLSYLAIARIAHHLLLFRKQDDAIIEHDVEINSEGAEVLYILSNLSDAQFQEKLNLIARFSGL